MTLAIALFSVCPVYIDLSISPHYVYVGIVKLIKLLCERSAVTALPLDSAAGLPSDLTLTSSMCGHWPTTLLKVSHPPVASFDIGLFYVTAVAFSMLSY